MSENLPEKPENQLIAEFLDYQKQELAHRSKELDLRKHEIESNERIAIASIEAQKADSANKGAFFEKMVTSRHRTVTLVSLIVGAVVLASILTGKTEVAVEIIKVGGAVLLGYIAGLNKGKAQVLENHSRKNED